MKKIILIAVLGFLVFSVSLVLAEEDDDKTKTSKPQEVFDQLKNWEKNLRIPDLSEIEKGSSLKSFLVSSSGNAKITDAEVISANDAGFSVKVWGLTVKVAVDSETRFLIGKLRDWSLAELRAGDRVDVLGEMQNETDGIVKAKVVNGKISAPRIQDEEVVRLRTVVQGLVKQLQEALRKLGKQLPPDISPILELSPSPAVSPTPTPSVSVQPSP
ncbi:MAG: hypothetical protein UX26_C0010G0009 [Parcubacteria group bacterium GW2011_GWC1_45_9]|nr:MAG: hypothetical protein UX26_C0010G0009 [Parcubacteria group bacterium GW2011_GWC1_45_9]